MLHTFYKMLDELHKKANEILEEFFKMFDEFVTKYGAVCLNAGILIAILMIAIGSLVFITACEDENRSLGASAVAAGICSLFIIIMFII